MRKGEQFVMDEVRARRPELPNEKRARFVQQYAVTEYDASVLANDLELAAYFEQAARNRTVAANRAAVGADELPAAQAFRLVGEDHALAADVATPRNPMPVGW